MKNKNKTLKLILKIMQNKSFIRVACIALVFLTFCIVTSCGYGENVKKNKVNMSITLEVSVPDILVALSDYNETDIFKQAIENAKQRTSNDFLTDFMEEFEKIDPNAKLAAIFSTYEMRDKIQLSYTNAQVISVLKDEVKAALDNSFNVLRTRIDRFGIKKSNIQRISGTSRILVELHGITEPERVRNLLQCSGNIEFWETFDASELSGIMIDANSILRNLQENSAKKVVKPQKVKDNSTSELDSLAEMLKISEEEIFIKNNPLFGLGINDRPMKYDGPVLGVVLEKDTAEINKIFNLPQIKRLFPPNFSFKWTVKPIVEDKYGLIAIKFSIRNGRAPLTGDVIINAESLFDEYRRPVIVIKMNAEGAAIFARLTKANIGKSIAISLDNYVYAYPKVVSEIINGYAEISGNFTVDEAKDMANILKSGRMPAPVRIVQEDVTK